MLFLFLFFAFYAFTLCVNIFGFSVLSYWALFVWPKFPFLFQLGLNIFLIHTPCILLSNIQVNKNLFCIFFSLFFSLLCLSHCLFYVVNTVILRLFVFTRLVFLLVMLKPLSFLLLEKSALFVIALATLSRPVINSMSSLLATNSPIGHPKPIIWLLLTLSLSFFLKNKM